MGGVRGRGHGAKCAPNASLDVVFYDKYAPNASLEAVLMLKGLVCGLVLAPWPRQRGGGSGGGVWEGWAGAGMGPNVRQMRVWRQLWG